MSIDPLTAIFDLGKTTIERIWPDANKRAEEIRKLEELRQNGDLSTLNAHVQLMLAQIDVNRESAKHKSVFVAGARPFIIWVGGLTMLWAGLLHPVMTWVWALNGFDGSPPEIIDSGAIFGVMTALLGFGTMRSVDKYNGVQTDRI